MENSMPHCINTMVGLSWLFYTVVIYLGILEQIHIEIIFCSQQ